ncbi:oocyte zinc finger protein XlCOF20-like [Littorina saxatilis]|uniref:oocyte zinc finger protein XlCOF20-like n=1 Tax=Littorina saxatilis TaxID=31220 RepID=UPI0038B69A94
MAKTDPDSEHHVSITQIIGDTATSPATSISTTDTETDFDSETSSSEQPLTEYTCRISGTQSQLATSLSQQSQLSIAQSQVPGTQSQLSRTQSQLSRTQSQQSQISRTQSQLSGTQSQQSHISRTQSHQSQISRTQSQLSGTQSQQSHISRTQFHQSQISRAQSQIPRSQSQLSKTQSRETKVESKPSHVCDVCGKRLSCHYSLQRHQLYQHDTDKDRNPFRCSRFPCSRVFATQQRLDRHVRTEHLGDKPFVCNRCGRRFGLRHYLSEHLLRCQRVGFPCDRCEAKFTNRPALINHRRVKHEGIVPVCVCGKAFSCASTRNKHARKCPVKHPHLHGCA